MTETKYMTVLGIVAAIMASVIFALLVSGWTLLSTYPHLLYGGIALYALSFVMSVVHVKRKNFDDIEQDDADRHSAPAAGEEAQQ